MGQPVTLTSTNVPRKLSPIGPVIHSAPETTNLTPIKPPSPLKTQLIMQSLCNESFPPTAVENPYRYNSTPSTLQRSTADSMETSDVLNDGSGKGSRSEFANHQTRLTKMGTQRRRSVDLIEQMVPTRLEEAYALKCQPPVRSESQTPSVPRTAFAERLLIARKAVDEGKLGSFRSSEPDDTIHLNFARRLREELESEVPISYPMNEGHKTRGANICMSQKTGTRGVEVYSDLLDKSEMTTRTQLSQTGQTFVSRQRAVSTDPHCYLSRSMPVQVVKPALRQAVALDSSGHDTGSPSDSTASMKSDERPSLFDPDRRAKRLSADSASAQDERVTEPKPKSALVSEHKRTQRQQKYDKSGGPQRTVVWMDEICGDSSPNLSDGKRDSANETQESSSVRSNTQTYLYPEQDIPGRLELNEAVLRKDGLSSLGIGCTQDERSMMCMDVQIRPTNYATDPAKQHKYRRSLPDPRLMSKQWPTDGE
ncbi:unnamed protein product [Echinostoma caproni]|uniref:PH domain-containing protein n=1 Tax=Echinostoma caproni TaxID=27848 RepID=A0A183AB15_9TREM|nr:unnamed protein product [Echinostoma caproni]